MTLSPDEIKQIASETAKQEASRVRWTILVPAFLAICGWAYSLGGQSQDIRNLKEDVKNNKEKAEKIIVIQNDIKHIRTSIDDLKKAVTSIAEKEDNS